MWLRPLEDMEMMGSTNPVLNRHFGGRTNFEVGDCAAISSTNLWPATRFGHTGNSCGSAINDFYSWDDMKPIGAITLKWRLNTPRPTPHGFLCYFDAVNPEDPEVTVTEWGDFCDSVDLHAGPVAGRCWKALGKIFALGVLGDHGYGESLTKRFDFCPRCCYLARCYAYVWVLCCWGHLSNGIRMRLLWIRMLALTCSSFEVKSGAAMHLTVIQISVLVPTFFAWWGAPLVECYPQVAMCNCLWLVLGIERLHCSSCCKWCSSMYFDSLSWLAATWCNFAWYSRLPWVNDYAIFGCVPSLDGWVDVNLSRCFSGNMLFPCKSVVENPLLLCQYGIASRPGGVSDYVGVQVMDSTFALSLEDMFHLDKRSHEHHGWSSRTRSRGHRVLPSP